MIGSAPLSIPSLFYSLCFSPTFLLIHFIFPSQSIAASSSPVSASNPSVFLLSLSLSGPILPVSPPFSVAIPLIPPFLGFPLFPGVSRYLGLCRGFCLFFFASPLSQTSPSISSSSSRPFYSAPAPAPLSSFLGLILFLYLIHFSSCPLLCKFLSLFFSDLISVLSSPFSAPSLLLTWAPISTSFFSFFPLLSLLIFSENAKNFKIFPDRLTHC